MVAEWMERADAAAAPSKRHERNEPLTYSLRSLGCLLVPSRSLIPPLLARPLARARPRTRRAVLTCALPARSRAASLGGALPGRVVRLAAD